MNRKSENHERVVVDQFTRQAGQFREFAEMPGKPRDMIFAATEIDAGDTILDVACGPGVTTCDLAEVAGHATGAELEQLFIQAGLAVPKTVFYKHRMALESLLKGSFPNPGDSERVRQIIVDDEGKDELGLGVHRIDGDLHFAYPIVVLVGRKVGTS